MCDNGRFLFCCLSHVLLSLFRLSFLKLFPRPVVAFNFALLAASASSSSVTSSTLSSELNSSTLSCASARSCFVSSASAS